MAIELDHSFAVPVPPEQAWEVLLDVARVAPCMPGATVDEVDGDVVTGKIRVKVGPISLTYSGKATFTDKDEAAHAVKVDAAGKETRGAGTASATVQARLDDDNGQTRVSVHTSLNVTGRPAQFGRGVMAEVGGRLIEKFSANLAEQLAAGDAGPGDAPNGAGGSGAGSSTDSGGTDGSSTSGSSTSGSGTGGSSTGGSSTGGSSTGGAATATAASPVGPAGGSPAGPDARLGIPLQELNLTVRSFNSLKSEGIDTVGQLVARTPHDLLGIKNIGERSVEEIEEKLRDLGLGLAQAPQVTAAANGVPPAAAPSAALGSGGQATGTEEERAGWDGGTAAVTFAGRPDEDDAIDLLDVAAGPVLKRVLPAAGAAVVLIVVGFRLRRRLRSR